MLEEQHDKKYGDDPRSVSCYRRGIVTILVAPFGFASFLYVRYPALRELFRLPGMFTLLSPWFMSRTGPPTSLRLIYHFYSVSAVISHVISQYQRMKVK